MFFQPPGKGARLPEAVCVVSPVGERMLYEQMLHEVERCRAVSAECANELLQSAYTRPFPVPDTEVYIQTVVSSS